MTACYQAMVTYSPDVPTRKGMPVTIYADSPEQAVEKIRQFVPGGRSEGVQLQVSFQRVDEVDPTQTSPGKDFPT